MAIQTLLLVRHGEAHHGSPDELRELTPAGQAEVRNNLSKAADRLPALDLVFHSGLTRAMQTAEIVTGQLAPQLYPQYLDGISPWGDPLTFCESLTNESAETLLVVSHNPFLEELISYLTGESPRMKTGSVACLEVDFLARGCCNLSWIVH